MESIEGVGSATGVGFGFWRLGSGELGGEVADMVVASEIRRDGKSCRGRRDARGSRRPLNGLESTQQCVIYSIGDIYSEISLASFSQVTI